MRLEIPMQICGAGSYLPGKPRLSADLDSIHGLDPGTVRHLTGVESRHFCGDQDDQISMGVAAARRAMKEAEVDHTDIDLIISAAAVPYQPIPSTAPLYQRALGIADGTAYAFDINSTCLSFVTALDVCEGLFAGQRYKTALIISSEVASRALPWKTHPGVAGLFGDGAAAVVVRKGGRALTTLTRTYPSAYESCGIGAGGTRFDFHRDEPTFAAHALFDMEGKDLFRVTARYFTGFVDDLIARSGWHRDAIDLVVPHQASPRALSRMIRQCGFAESQVLNISATVGNQVAASIPFGLCQARSHLAAGSNVLLLGTSAGVSFGGVALIL
ncbi:3-oxoacyl-ACP synthase III family protein [Yoonia sp. 2307UL14-13]|uniref:3-oxoacyl-ACP synthase III family protein n=1 Tax=Yoonia sp. 2307UL14-13 TaxID=3126506 RepID=UPI00309645E1